MSNDTSLKKDVEANLNLLNKLFITVKCKKAIAKNNYRPKFIFYRVDFFAVFGYISAKNLPFLIWNINIHI